MNVYDIIKESYNTDDEIIEEGLFKKVKEIIKGKNKRKDEKDTPSSNNSIKDDKTPYVVKKITSKSMLDKFYKNDAFCIECAPKDPTFPQIIANILNMNYEINTPIEIYFVTGKVFNDVYDLAGDNAYENSVHHAIIPFKVLKNTNDISYAKPQLRSRYFRDVVDNNEYREYIAGRHKKSPQIQWLINAYTNESYYDENELHTSNLIKEENTMSINILANFAREAGFENYLIGNDIIEGFNKTIDTLDTIDESVLTGDISILPVYSVDESYFIDLETLNTVAKVYEVELNEAMNLLKEVNDLSEDTDVSVVLKEGFENYTTLEEFVELKNILNESGINLAWDKELSADDFITEAGKMSDAIDKVKDKIKKMSIDSLEKTITKCEESNKKLNEEMQKLDKMSKEEASKYVEKQANKNLAVVSAYLGTSMVSGWATGVLIVAKPLVGIPVYAGLLKSVNSVGAKLNRSGKTIITSNVDKYKKAINNTIKINNKTIKECNNIIKAKK